MGIESDADKDLALSDEDAEGVVGGHKTKKAKVAHHTTTHTAAAPTPSVKVIYDPAPAAPPPPPTPSSPSQASSPSAPSSPTSDC